MSSQLVAQPAWAIKDYLEVRDGSLTINGVDALALVRAHGSPLYVFSAPRISANIARLKRAPKRSNIQSDISMPQKQTQTWLCSRRCATRGLTLK